MASGNKKKSLIVLIICGVLWLLFIFFRSFKSGYASTLESEWVLRLIRRIWPSAKMLFVRKMAHFTEFFILGALLSGTWAAYASFRGRRFVYWKDVLIPSLCALAAAVCDELIQLTSPGRACQISDMLLDFSGALLAALIVAFVIWCVKRRKA